MDYYVKVKNTTTDEKKEVKVKSSKVINWKGYDLVIANALSGLTPKKEYYVYYDGLFIPDTLGSSIKESKQKFLTLTKDHKFTAALIETINRIQWEDEL